MPMILFARATRESPVVSHRDLATAFALLGGTNAPLRLSAAKSMPLIGLCALSLTTLHDNKAVITRARDARLIEAIII
jgi:hypothetical protein